jgi:hypothetical protein
MSRLRVLICRVEEHDDQLTELARADLPPLRPQLGPACLELLEAQVAQASQRLLARLGELHWEDLDAQAVARYAAVQPPGTVVADGYQQLQVASRFGTLQLRRPV